MAGTNNFLPWDPGATNMLSDDDYSASSIRSGGHSQGIASSAAENKALHQATTMVAAFAQFLANSGQNVSDNDLNALITSITTVLTPATMPTGVGMDYWGPTAPSGWLFTDGKTIGNATSNATSRANTDTQTLFNLIWNNTLNTNCAIYNSDGSAGTRGASAAADWAANKAIALPDIRGRTRIALDNMGGTSANRVTSASTGGNNATAIAGSGGAETHTLSIGQMPAHQHSYTIFPLTGGAQGSPGSGNQSGSANTSAVGGSQAHNNTQPWIACNYIIKL